MINRWNVGLLAAALAFAASSAHSAPARAKAKKKAKPAAEQADASADDQQAPGLDGGDSVDRKRFELYLKQRLKKIDDANKSRLDFFNKEQETWTSFWNKVRDERRIFEVRVTRQTLDLFESLASLDPKDYPTTIANFEKLQTDVIRSFETGQKDKMAEFFAAREDRWKQFAADQEKEREDFVADAQQGWEDAKSSLKNPDQAAAQPADGDAQADADAQPAPKPKPKPRPRPVHRKVTGAGDDWH